MKAGFILAVLIIVTTILSALHLNAPITCILPFLGGLSPSIYDFVGVAVLLTTLWGLWYLGRNHRHHE
jgi:hypothetical protein